MTIHNTKTNMGEKNVCMCLCVCEIKTFFFCARMGKTELFHTFQIYVLPIVVVVNLLCEL
jgi:hypothetical protein